MLAASLERSMVPRVFCVKVWSLSLLTASCFWLKIERIGGYRQSAREEVEPRFDVIWVHWHHLGCGFLCFVFPKGKEIQRNYGSSGAWLHCQSAAELAMCVACGGISSGWLSLAGVAVRFSSDLCDGSWGWSFLVHIQLARGPHSAQEYSSRVKQMLTRWFSVAL